MRRISKQYRSRAGFTFTELVSVVGILIILACVLVYGINRLIKLAENSNSAVVNSSNQLKKQIDDSEQMLASYGFSVKQKSVTGA